MVIFAMPIFAQAATLEDLQAQLKAIVAQIAALQVVPALTTPSGNTIPSCPNFTRTLGRGMKGNDVTVLQQFLIAQKLLASDSATGYFGSLTEKSLQEWQKKNGIVSEGTAQTTGYGAAGPKTRALMSDCSHLDVPLSILTPVGSGWTDVPVNPQPTSIPPQTVVPPSGVLTPITSSTTPLE